MYKLDSHINEFSSAYYKIFKPYLSKPQFENFRIMTNGILNGIPSAETTARIFSSKDPSTVRKFMSASPWNEEKINQVRISHANQVLNQHFMKYVPIAIDDSNNRKYGKQLPGSGYYYSNTLDKTVWSQTVVTSHLTIADHDIPLHSDLYFKKEQCKDTNREFRSKIDIAMDQIDAALNLLKLQTNQIGVVTADSWYPATKLINKIIDSVFEAVLAIKCNRIVFYEGKEIRVDQLAKQVDTSEENQFEEIVVEGTKYRVWTAKVGMPSVKQDKIKLLINKKMKNNGEWPSDFKYLISTDINMGPWTMLYLYQKRWIIETFCKFGKERLGFDKSRVESERTLSRFFILLFCVYTLISLSQCGLYFHHIQSKSKYEVQEKLLNRLQKEMIVWVYIQGKNEVNLEDILLKLGFTEKFA